MHLIVFVDIDEVVRDEVVVRYIPIVQRLDMIEYGLDILDVPRRSHPQLLARILKTFCLNVAHLVNGEVALLSPLELLIKEVQHREVEGPDVIPPSQVNVVVGVE